MKEDMRKNAVRFGIGIVFLWAVFGSVFLWIFSDYDSASRFGEQWFSGDIEKESPRIVEKECPISDVLSDDGDADRTIVLQQAIDHCSESGGGTVRISAGEWRIGPLEMKNGVRLFLEKDARMVFSSEKKRYERGVLNRLEGIEIVGLTPLVTAQDCHDIAIAGEGTIDGGGDAWYNGGNGSAFENFIFARAYEAVSQGVPAEKRDFSSGDIFSRPDMFLIRNCDRVSMEGVVLSNSPRWMMHFLYSKHISVKNVRIENGGDNTDGIVIDSSRDVLVEKTTIRSGDDALVMKSGLGADGRRVGIPTERVMIHDVSVDGAHGGIVIGSEMSGGVRDVLAEKVLVKNAWSAARIKAPNGRGGFVRNVVMRDIAYENISQNAIHIDSEYTYNAMAQEKTGVENVPDIENILFENIRGTEAQRMIDIDGLSEKPAKNIVMKNLDMRGDKGVSIKNVSGLTITDSVLDVDFGKVKKKEVFALENADRVFTESLDCQSVPASKCVNVEKNSGRKSFFLEKGFLLPVIREGNIILGPKILFFPWYFL